MMRPSIFFAIFAGSGFCGHIFRNVWRSKEGDFTIYMEAEISGNEKASVDGACNPCPALRE